MTPIRVRFVTPAGTHRTAPAFLIRYGRAGSAFIRLNDGLERWVPAHWIVKEDQQ